MHQHYGDDLETCAGEGVEEDIHSPPGRDPSSWTNHAVDPVRQLALLARSHLHSAGPLSTSEYIFLVNILLGLSSVGPESIHIHTLAKSANVQPQGSGYFAR